jgi:Cu/Ag efflux pump CusA
MQGKVVSQMIEAERQFDIIVLFSDRYRENFEELGRIPIELPDGGTIPLSTVADIYEYGGPNTINREDARRRIVVRVFTDGADLAPPSLQFARKSPRKLSSQKAISCSTAGNSKPNKRRQNRF